MTVQLNHPAVAGYLDRVATAAAAAGLPAGRRAELDAELRGHLAEALGPDPDDAAVGTALDRLGSPEEIVAAEAQQRGLPVEAPAPGWASPAPAAVPPGYRPPSVWGVGEVLAVLGLTVGAFVLPVVGPLIGLVLAWASPRWTRAEKVIATVISGIPLAVIGFLVVEVMTMRSTL